MNKIEFADYIKYFIDKQVDLLALKGADYQQEGDALSNFKEIAVSSGRSPLEVWHTLMHKHLVAINNFVKGQELKCEGIESRLLDLANFALLGGALIKENGISSPYSSVLENYGRMKNLYGKALEKRNFLVLDEDDGGID